MTDSSKLRSKSPLSVFLLWLFASIVLFTISLAFLGWERWQYLFFIFRDPDDSFMDFFNPIAWVVPLKSAYSNVLNIYPPLLTTCCGLIGKLFHFEPGLPAKVIRASVSGKFALGLYFTSTLAAFFALLYKYKQGFKWEKVLFCLAVALSTPFLFWFERANYIILALIGSLFFLMHYKDDRPAWRQAALLALAGAISVKIYPAVFGMFLLKEHRWKDICYLGIYTALAFLIPFIWLGGFSQIRTYISNLGQNAAFFPGYGYGLSAVSSFALLAAEKMTHGSKHLYHVYQEIMHAIPFIILIGGAVSAYFSKQNWKTLALLCLLIVLIPSISFTYVEIFMILPLAAFFNEEKTFTSENISYFLLLSVLFVIHLPFIIFPALHLNQVFLDNFISRFALVILFGALVYDTLKSTLKGFYGRR